MLLPVIDLTTCWQEHSYSSRQKIICSQGSLSTLEDISSYLSPNCYDIQSHGTRLGSPAWAHFTRQTSVRFSNGPTSTWEILPCSSYSSEAQLTSLMCDFRNWALLSLVLRKNLGFPDSSVGKESSALQETSVWSLSWEDPLEKG